MKITVVLNPDNKHRNALFIGERMIVNANSGLKDVKIQYEDNKRAVLHLTITDFNLVVQNDKCPEAGRFADIQRAFGDRNAIAALRPACEMLSITPTACDGCPKNPVAKLSSAANQSPLKLAAE